MTNDASDNQYDRDHIVLWVRWLQFKGLDVEAIRGEVDNWSMYGVTQVYVGTHARTMPTYLVRAIVEQALADERAIPSRSTIQLSGQQILGD
jgi:hypothetical protein